VLSIQGTVCALQRWAVNLSVMKASGEPVLGQQDSQLLQDFLLDMDFNEFIPVNNDFFNGYVQTLDYAPQSRCEVAPATVQQAAAHARPLDALMETVSLPFNESFPAIGNAVQLQRAVDPRLTSVDVQDTAAVPLSSQQRPQESRPIVTSPPICGASLGSGNSSDHNNADSIPRSRSRLKTLRQQSLNKAAQHRYRERKKAKALELEQAVASLKEKVEELGAVQCEKEKLEAKVEALEEQLVVRATAEAQTRDKATSNVKELNTSELISSYHDNIVVIRAFLTKHGYLDSVSDAQLKAMPAQHVMELETMVHACCNTCASIHQCMNTVDVYSLIEASIDRDQDASDGSKISLKDVVTGLQLDARTARAARFLREQYLDKLRDVYTERYELKLEAVKALLPADVGGLASVKWNQFEGRAYLTRHKECHRLSAVMKRLRDNLSAEQRSLAELDFFVYHKLLNLLQAAQCMVKAYPHHCDVISLLNAFEDSESSV
jgi:hypothetical protein